MKTEADAIEELRARAERELQELVEWCLSQDRHARCFPSWPPDLVRLYLTFHIRQKTICFVRDSQTSGPTSVGATFPMMGLGVCWQIREEFVRRAEFAARPWLYHHTDPDGDCLYIDNLIASDRRAIGVLMAELQFHWPNWRRLKLFGLRHRKLVEYAPERIFARVERIAL